MFPECSLTGYFDADFMKRFTAPELADAERQVAAACREHNVYAIVGTPHRAGDKLYNSAVVIDPSGKVVERYHKLQLAEPWPDEGDHLSVFKIDGVPCRYRLSRRAVSRAGPPAGAGRGGVIFYVSHESDITKETKIDPYRAQIQARAVENTVYVVQANAPANEDTTGSHGQSRVVAPDGRVEKEATIFGEDVVAASLDLRCADRRTGSPEHRAGAARGLVAGRHCPGANHRREKRGGRGCRQ